MARKLTKTTTDHEEIRRWVEERGGWPAEVARTAREGQTGILRIDFPGYAGEGSLEKISWDDWFRKFDESNLVFTYQETTADGERSNFNKLVARETAEARATGRRTTRRASARGTRAVPQRAVARTAGRASKTGRRSTSPRSSSRAGTKSRGATSSRAAARSRSGAASRGGTRSRRGTKKR